ncbi:MAG TPA: hypothetical protein VIM42_03375 [Clostridium sp.]
MLQIITRVQKSKDFSVNNNTWLKDTSLEWKVKGLLAYLLTLPDDEQICVKELATNSTDVSAVDSKLKVVFVCSIS